MIDLILHSARTYANNQHYASHRCHNKHNMIRWCTKKNLIVGQVDRPFFSPSLISTVGALHSIRSVTRLARTRCVISDHAARILAVCSLM
jgi:hypothetical protein